MIEIRLSTYDTYQQFVDAVEYYHKPTAQMLTHEGPRWHDYRQDIVVRLIIGKVEVVFEHEVQR